MKLKVSQTTARFLVVLVAQAVEGRRRVVYSLNGFSAQICERKTGLNIVSRRLDFEDNEMWALQLWGELCLGLADPSITGSSIQDPDKSLSLKVVWLMLKFGMVNALPHGV